MHLLVISLSAQVRPLRFPGFTGSIVASCWVTQPPMGTRSPLSTTPRLDHRSMPGSWDESSWALNISQGPPTALVHRQGRCWKPSLRVYAYLRIWADHVSRGRRGKFSVAYRAKVEPLLGSRGGHTWGGKMYQQV